MNPEFKRNLWLELSPGRLIGMTVVLGAIFVITVASVPDATSTATYDALQIVSSLMLFGLCGLWGTRRAAAAVPEEMAAGTWDAQRMSAIGAWSFTWSKVLGATAFPWFGGLICIGVGAVSLIASNAGTGRIVAFILLPISLVTAQLLSFIVSLTFVRKRRFEKRRGGTTLGHLVGLVAAAVFVKVNSTFPGATPGTQETPGIWDDPGRFFGIEIPAVPFLTLSALAFMAWAWLGAWRLMRAELQYETQPWAWPAFTAFCMIYVMGIVFSAPEEYTLRLLISMFVHLMTLMLTYVSVLAEDRDIVRYRRFLENLRARRLLKAFSDTPSWVLMFPFVIISSTLLAHSIIQPQSFVPSTDSIGWEFLGFDKLELSFVAYATPLFLLRDIQIAHLLDHFGQGKQKDAAWLVILIVLYVIAPGFIWSLGLTPLFGFAALDRLFLPGAAPEYLLFPLAEVFGLAVLLWWRVKSLETSVSRTVPPTPTTS